MDSFERRQMYRVKTDPEDDIVISGIAGRFPKSHNVSELCQNLYNKVDMVQYNINTLNYMGNDIPTSNGITYDVDKFDANFFSINKRAALSMDPQHRLLLEHAYEAVLDAGMCPKKLRGSKTAVYVGCCSAESDDFLMYNDTIKDGMGIFGSARAMMANRISFAMDFNGPSMQVDSACSSAGAALDLAYSAIRNGECEAAIVGASNIILTYGATIHFYRLGVLSQEGVCRPFDENANGYVRSESVNALFIQKRKDAKRVYATVVHSKVNVDGFKNEGLAFPSTRMQTKLIKELYADIEMDPRNVDYVECHGTATFVGDPVECSTIDNVFCTGRDQPLHIGSIKSNMGHTEGAASNCSVIKSILIFENEKLPAQLHITELRKSIPSLVAGRVKPVVDVTDFKGTLIGVNSFGFGGANSHILLKKHPKEKINRGLPTDNLPRLLTWSGRTENALNAIFDSVTKQPIDVEYFALLHNTQVATQSANTYRGYAIYQQEPESPAATCVERHIANFSESRRPIVWVYSGMGSQWIGMGADLMKIPIFENSIRRCHDVLAKKGVDLIKIITGDDPTTFDNILHSFIGISAVQIGITNILKAIGLEPDYIIGHSMGEIGCAYGDNTLTDEEMILTSYSRGLVSIQNDTIFGSMAAVEIGYKELKSMIDDGIEIGCHNSPDSCTISGPGEIVEKFVKNLKNQKIFAKEVPCMNIAYHSSYIADLGPHLLNSLISIIKDPKLRSDKWISTSVPKTEWNSIECRYSSAQYHSNNLVNPVLFEESCEYLPKNALTIEIAPHGLLQSVMKQTMPEAVHFCLTKRGSSDGSMIIYQQLGKLFENGIDFDLSKLYPAVDFPVSRTTPMIAPNIKWDHDISYRVPTRSDQIISQKTFDLSDPEFDSITGHVVDGRCIFPTTGYIYLAWKTLAAQLRENFETLDVELDDVKLIRACNIQKDREQKLTVLLEPGTGRFNISEGTSTLVTGVIRRCDDSTKLSNIKHEYSNENSLELDAASVYKELRIRGYHFKDLFKSNLSVMSDGTSSKIKWNGDWISFLDAILQIGIFVKQSRNLLLPISIQKVIIKSKEMADLGDDSVIDVKYYPDIEILRCLGVEIRGFESRLVGKRPPVGIPVLDSHQFIPHFPTPILSYSDVGRFCVQLITENLPVNKISCIEIDMNDNREALCEYFGAAVGDLPLITSELNYLTSKDIEISQTTVSKSQLSAFSNQTMVIRSNCLFDADFLENVKKSISDVSYIIFRESKDYEIIEDYEGCQGYKIVAVISTQTETLVMLQYKKDQLTIPASIIKITNTDNSFSWLEILQEKAKTEPTLIYAENESECGILGLANCIRREPGGQNLRCLFIDDESAPPFDIQHQFYKSQIEKDLAINVYRNGKWGSYKHLLIKSNNELLPREDTYYAEVLTKGDLSSIKWVQTQNIENSDNFVNVQYAGLNFRDIMLATGRLAPDVIFKSRVELFRLLGIEFAGITKDGRRVMGISQSGVLATHVEFDPFLIWDVPKDWSLEEAATVLNVYSTVYYAFFVNYKVEKGNSILIHAGSGGVGLAAIRVAFAYGLDVFTTVSTDEKKNYLLNEFPELKPENIGNSRDTSFENLIMMRTRGQGVDYVLNSLSEEKLAASVRCLKRRGVFFEIGKFDMSNDNKLSLKDFLKELSFLSINADSTAPKHIQLQIKKLLNDDIKKGIIKPLKANVFNADDLEGAFRFLASAKHIGKVVVKIREHENDIATIPMSVLQRVNCNPDYTYIICGGLGGFGLELADWLFIRGCRKLVLSTSRGITDKYQAFRTKCWESFGIHVQVNKSDITTKQGCEQLINDATKIGPVGGIFNLAVQLRDSILDNQTVTTFDQCMAPKAYATKYLDEISRSACPLLEYFVVFSSVACGRGNPGQTNYGMANSVMERIMEQRHSQGLPAKAIQWGAVGDVGIVAVMQEYAQKVEISGTLLQGISSCLQELDTLITDDSPIVSSMVVAEKRYKGPGKGGIIEMLMNILGIKNIQSLSLDAKLSELGMDSLMTVEISQALERDFNVTLTPKELRELTVAQLTNMQSENVSRDKIKTHMDMLVSSLGDESTSNVTILKLNDKSEDGNIKALILPGIEGVAGQMYYDFANNLKYPTYLLQGVNNYKNSDFNEMCSVLFEDVSKLYSNDSKFLLLGYSYGSAIAIKMAEMLESMRKSGKVFFIDGSPKLVKKLITESVPAVNDVEGEIEKIVLDFCIKYLFPNDTGDRKNHVLGELTLLAKYFRFVELYPELKAYSKEYFITIVTLLRNRMIAMYNLSLDGFPVLKSPVQLIKSADATTTNDDDKSELKAYTESEIEVTNVDGNRDKIFQDQTLLEIINSAYYLS